MRAQFYRIESYGLSSPGKKSTIRQIVAEAMRKPYACKHVSNPSIPTVLYGYNLLNTAKTILKIKKEYEKTATRKLLPNAQLLVGAIASYPHTVEELLQDPLEYHRYLFWRKLNIEFAKTEYGDHLHGVIEHMDEGHPHLHIWAKAQVINGKLTLGSCHPGQLAERGKEPKQRIPAYKEAMKALQNRYWLAVGKIFGMLRLSVTPSKRLSFKMSKVKKRKDKEKDNETNKSIRADPINAQPMRTTTRIDYGRSFRP